MTIDQYPKNKESKNKTLSMWNAVWAMALCAMILISSEFLPVSLLTPIASDLSITEGQAGQAISISGLFALLTSLFLASIIGNINRRTILLFFTALMGVSGVIVCLAPNATILMLGRALLGVCIGGFWSMSAATMMRLVPADSVPKALAILNGGNAFAVAIAAPLGSYLGGIIGWRGAFFTIIPLALIAFVWQWMTVPSLPAKTGSTKKRAFLNTFRLLGSLQMALGMLAVMLFFMGQFTLFTYLRPFLEEHTGVDVEQLSLLLLTLGVFGLLGTIWISQLLKTYLYSLLIIIPFLMMVIAFSLIKFGDSLAATFVLLAFWGLLATAAPVAWWTWLSQELTSDAEAGGGLMVAIIQLAITLGAAGGGLLYDATGYEGTFNTSAGILLLASLFSIATWYQSEIKAANQMIITGN